MKLFIWWVSFLWILGLYQTFWWWCYGHAFCHFSQKDGGTNVALVIWESLQWLSFCLCRFLLSTAKALGSGSKKYTYQSWWFMRETRRSKVGFRNILEIFWNKWVFSFHVIVSLKFLEKMSAQMFCVPETCAADTYIFCVVHHTHSSFTVWLQISDLFPSLLFT